MYVALVGPSVDEDVLALKIGPDKHGIGPVAGPTRPCTVAGARTARLPAVAWAAPAASTWAKSFIGLNSAAGVDVEAGAAGNGF